MAQKTSELSSKKKDKNGFASLGYKKNSIIGEPSVEIKNPAINYLQRQCWKYIYFVRYFKTKDFKFTNILELVKKQIAEEDARKEKQIASITTLLKPTIMATVEKNVTA